MGEGLLTCLVFGAHMPDPLVVHPSSSPTPSSTMSQYKSAASLAVGGSAFNAIDKMSILSAVEAIASDLGPSSMVQSSPASNSGSSAGEGPGGMSASPTSDNQGNGGSGRVGGNSIISEDDYRIIARFLRWLRRLLHLDK